MSSILRHSVARTVLRPRRFTPAVRRQASTEATQKKAQETLASVQQNAGKFLDAAKKFLEPAGEKIGQLLGCELFFLIGLCRKGELLPHCLSFKHAVFLLSHRSYLCETHYPCFSAYKQPLLYNLAVTREVVKQIYIAESLQPPSLATIRAAYETIWTRAINPTYWRGIAQSGEILKVGIYGVEAYTIFKVCPCLLYALVPGAYSPSSLFLAHYFSWTGWRNIGSPKPCWLRSALEFSLHCCVHQHLIHKVIEILAALAVA